MWWRRRRSGGGEYVGAVGVEHLNHFYLESGEEVLKIIPSHLLIEILNGENIRKARDNRSGVDHW